MGRVWRGRDQLLDREVAVKEILLDRLPPGADSAQVVARAMREARAEARLDHPSAVAIYDVVEGEGAPWIVMRFVSGPSLGAEIARSGHLPWRRVAEIGGQVADALAHAHAAGIVHRDLKPDNILLSPDRAVITDFGIARIADSPVKLTWTGTVVGTPHYMAPEQLEGHPVGPPADMWSLGATLYTATEGVPPFDAASLTAVIAAVLTKDVPPPRRAGPLAHLLLTLLDRDPARRPAAPEVARALAAYSAEPASGAHQPATVAASARQPGATVPRRGPGRRRPVALISAALLLAAAGTGIGLWLGPSSPALSATPPHSPASASSSSHGPASPAAPARPPASSPAAPASSPASSAGGRTVDTCARAASVTPDPVKIGSITTGTAANDFVDVAFSPDCQVVAAGGNGVVQEWDMVTGHRIATVPAAPGGYAFGDVFTPNGQDLAVGGGNGDTTLWNAATGRLITSFPSDVPGGTYCVAMSPDGTEIFTGGSSGVVGVWSVTTHQSIASISTGQSVGAMALSPNGELLAVGGYDGNIRVYNTASRTLVAELPGDQGHIWDMAFSPDGSTLAVGSNVLQWWNVATRTLIAAASSPGGDVTDVAFNPAGTTLAAGGYEMVGIWNASAHRLITTRNLGVPSAGASANEYYPNGLAFSRYGAILAVGWDGTLQFWNVAGR